MHASSFIGAAVLIATAAFLFPFGRPEADSLPSATPRPTADASGHYVLVIEGDRDHLAITHASRKEAPWGGIPKGLVSDWRVSVRDAEGREIASVPLDMSKFDLRPESKGKGLSVQGCVVTDTKVGMLASVPNFAEADRYVLLRGETAVGESAAAAVAELAGGGR